MKDRDNIYSCKECGFEGIPEVETYSDGTQEGGRQRKVTEVSCPECKQSSFLGSK